MKTTTILATLALTLTPLLLSHAEGNYSANNFKTLEEFRAAALDAKSTMTLTEDEKRQQRLLAITRTKNSGVNRVASLAESFKKKRSDTSMRSGKFKGNTIGKTRAFRDSRVLSNSSLYRPSERIMEDKAMMSEMTVQERLQKRRMMMQDKATMMEKDYADFTPAEGQEWGL